MTEVEKKLLEKMRNHPQKDEVISALINKWKEREQHT